MSSLSTDRVRPARIPQGFKFRRRVEGEVAAGFPGQAEQVTLVHTRGVRRTDWVFPLQVHAATAPDAELSATERRPGKSVDLGLRGVTAVYHDGMWAMNAAKADARGRLEDGLFWDTSKAHSITVRTADRVLAVRAPRDVSLAELLDIARSLPLTS